MITEKSYFSANQTRQLFLDYFKQKNHTIVKSSLLIPENDPTLLFTNAGMVQFKDLFLGKEKRSYTRAASSQKCLRVSGKHNDLDIVGFTPRHHTFFEMLGNFSFGDYFKKEALEFAWEFLTGWLNIPMDKLRATVYEEDEEAFQLWNEHIGLARERIFRLGEKDNFWAMAETGPCGPCSEVHYDYGPEVGCQKPECSPACDCGRFVEIWNLVFTQFDRQSDGSYQKLEKPSVDTGLGLERLCCLTQGVTSNYHTDLFIPIIKRIEELSLRNYRSDAKDDISMQVIADHCRALAFLLADGVLPANVGRGYVLRRILRRAARHGVLLGIPGEFLYQVADVVADLMRSEYPELHEHRQYIAQILRSEEQRFGRTLECGMRILDQIQEQIQKEGKNKISGEEIFRLHDTYGFPLDLTREVAKGYHLELDETGFEQLMQEQRNKARTAWKGSGEEAIAPVYIQLLEEFGATDFSGFGETQSANCHLLAILKDGQQIKSLETAQEGEVLLDRTPFYGEAGGQVGDTGFIKFNEKAKLELIDTVKPIPQLIIHKVKVTEGKLESDLKNINGFAKVDALRRQNIARNHTATHLLHAALRQILGEHVKQFGSLVEPHRLRFDFTHFEPISSPQLANIESIINEYVRRNIPVKTVLTSLEEAQKTGAMALFGEKYEDQVRMVMLTKSEHDPTVSCELCGGIHVSATGEIGLFKILSEKSAAAGVRRIEALTGHYAIEYIQKQQEILEHICDLCKGGSQDVIERVCRLQERAKSLENELKKTKSIQRKGSLEDILQNFIAINGIKVVYSKLEAVDRNQLRDISDQIRDRLGSGVVVLGSVIEGKPAFVCVVTKDLTSQLHAGKIANSIAELTGGSGGGRADMAQAGGKDPTRLDQALEKSPQIIKEFLSI